MKPTSPKILCIEDDVETGGPTAEELAKHGYTTVTAHDGESGLAMTLHEAPNLMPCDVDISDTTGFELLGQLRTFVSHCAEIPFVFLTAMTQRESELCGRRPSADNCVTKPVDFEILISIVQAWLAK